MFSPIIKQSTNILTSASQGKVDYADPQFPIISSIAYVDQYVNTFKTMKNELWTELGVLTLQNKGNTQQNNMEVQLLNNNAVNLNKLYIKTYTPFFEKLIYSLLEFIYGTSIKLDVNDIKIEWELSTQLDYYFRVTPEMLLDKEQTPNNNNTHSVKEGNENE